MLTANRRHIRWILKRIYFFEISVYVYIYVFIYLLGLPRRLSYNESACNAGDTGDAASVPGWGTSPGGGNGNPLQYSCLKKSHGQSSLAGYSPRSCKESDMTEHENTAIYLAALGLSRDT